MRPLELSNVLPKVAQLFRPSPCAHRRAPLCLQRAWLRSELYTEGKLDQALGRAHAQKQAPVQILQTVFPNRAPI